MAAALTSSLLALPLLQWAPRYGFVDAPGGRKQHGAVTPLLGGVAIYFSVVLFVLPYAALHGHSRVSLVMGGAAIMFVLGLVDDHTPLSVTTKLFAQFAASMILTMAGLRLYLLEPMPDALLTMVFVVLITNAFNLLDNMDGLTAGVVAVIALAFSTIASASGQIELAVLAAVVAGAAIGFLPHNLAPARMFMGDAGALPLGFLVSAMTLMLIDATTAERRLIPLIALALPLIDTTVVITSRLRRGINPLTHPSCDHVSHRLAAILGTRGLAVIACWGGVLLCSTIMVLLLV